MKPTFAKLLGLVLLFAFLTVSSASPTAAQPPDPPVIMENGEILQDLYLIDQAITERRLATVDGGDNAINVANSYWSSSGTTFVPAASTITYNYGGDGCVDTSAESDVWRGSVNVPHGSTITGMYFNYSNEVVDPADSTIYLRRYRYSGTYDDLLLVGGSYTGTGNHTQSTFTVSYGLVDNYNYAYVLVWIGRTTQNLCGVNLIYSPPPIYLNALPLITR